MQSRAKAAIALILVIAAVVAALTIDIPDPEPLRERVAAAGAWGVAAFVAVYVLVTLTPFPASALTIASGLLFGLAVGAGVVLVAATVGSWVGFRLARWLGRDAVARIGWARVTSIDAMIGRRGFVSILLIRLIPVFPLVAVNYAAGLSAVRERDYLLGTVLGIVPATIGYTALGAYGTSPLSWPFLVAVAAVAAIAVGAGLAAKKMKVTTS
ncbi:TVP38/TMEM64 family protein [Actinomycetes bacterium M1A6_2h]